MRGFLRWLDFLLQTGPAGNGRYRKQALLKKALAGRGVSQGIIEVTIPGPGLLPESKPAPGPTLRVTGFAKSWKIVIHAAAKNP